MKIYVSIIQLHVYLLFGKEAPISFGKKIEKNLKQHLSMETYGLPYVCKEMSVYVMRVYKEAS